MEILIVGFILVALMAYVSTRVKKSAASAYETETIETGEFFLIKSEGLISPVGGDSEFAFEAFSKDFGASDETEKLYRAQASLRIYENEDFAAYCEKAAKTFDVILAEETRGAQGGQKICLLKGEKMETGVPTLLYRKIVSKEPQVYDLQATFLSDYDHDFSEKIENLIESFRVK